jgi:F420H(2)-dependent quinone reductase
MASAPPKWITKAFTSAHIFLYRISKGKLGGTLGNFPILLLTTTGRKSGRARTTPLVYLRNEEEYLIAASAGGADRHPVWFLNLQNKPEAIIEVNGKAFNVQAAIPGDTERIRLYERFKTTGDNFVQYEQNTKRPIPVIRLKPVTP